MSLVGEVQTIENEISKLERTKSFLEEKGFEVIGGEISIPEEEARRVLESSKYDANPVIQRMRIGESFQDIADEIISQKPRYMARMPWKKELRDEYNNKITHLEEVVPLENLHELKIRAIYNSLTLLVGSMWAAATPLVYREDMPNTFFETMGIMAVFGSLMGFLFSTVTPKNLELKSIEESSRYIERSFGRL